MDFVNLSVTWAVKGGSDVSFMTKLRGICLRQYLHDEGLVCAKVLEFARSNPDHFHMWRPALFNDCSRIEILGLRSF